MNVENISIAVKQTGADTAAKHINSLANALESLEKVSSHISGISNLSSLASSLAALSQNKIPSGAIAGLATGIDNLSKALATLDINKFATLGQLQGALSGFEGFKGSIAGIANGVKTLADTLKKLSDDDIARIKKIADALSGMNGFHGSTSGIAKGIESLSVTLASITDDDIEKLNKIADALSRISTNAGGLSSGASQIGSALQSTASSGHSVGSALKSISSHGHKASSSLRSLGDSAKHSTGMLGKLWASIKRIAFYRLLRTLIKNITKDLQEGLKNAYTFSKGIAGSLAQAMDGLSAQYSQMKNQMGAAFGELLQTIMPIIEAIVGAITRLMAALSALFAALGGRAKYLSAGKSEAEDWDKATGSAKEYKNTILGFDEINRLNDENGGGGGGGGADPGVWQLSDLPDWAQKIKDAIDNGDWYEAGQALADHLNDLIENWDAYAAGQKIGKKINNAINFALGFLRRFRFERAGQKVAQFFNGLLSEVETDKLGAVVTRLITGPIDFLIGFIEDLDAKQLGSKVGDFFTGLFSEATDWLNEHDWKEFGKTITTKITEFFTNLKPEDVADAVSEFLITLFQAIGDFFEGGEWEEAGFSIGDTISKFVERVDWDSIAESIWRALGEALGAAAGFSGGLFEGLLGQKIQGIVEELTLLLSDASLVIGAILLFTGHIPLGLGLMIAGLAGKDKADENWDKVPTQVQEKIALIELAASGAMLALGIILAISGAALPLGLGLIAAGGVMLATRAQEDWDKLPRDVQTQLTLIGTLAGIVLLALGIILLLSGVGAPLGIGIILASVAVLGVTVASFDLDGTTNDINGSMESIGSTGETEFGKIADAIGWVIQAVKDVIEWFGKMKSAVTEVNNRLNDIDAHKATYGDAWGEMVRGAEIGAWASGGMPETGSLFIAGEAGAEIVSNLGNGRTGVTNVEQMEAAVANGNANVVNAVYAMANMIVKAVNEIDPDITLDGESLADKMYSYNQSAQRRHGAAMVT